MILETQMNGNIIRIINYINSYADIRPSINQEGGAEYSYNFWVYIV